MDDNSNSGGFVSRLQSWAMYPITNQMGILDIVLTTVLVITTAMVWFWVLKHLTAAAETVA